MDGEQMKHAPFKLNRKRERGRTLYGIWIQAWLFRSIDLVWIQGLGWEARIIYIPDGWLEGILVTKEFNYWKDRVDAIDDQKRVFSSTQ